MSGKHMYGLTGMAGWGVSSGIAAITAERLGPVELYIGLGNVINDGSIAIGSLELGLAAGIAVYAVLAREWRKEVRRQRIGQDALLGGVALIVLMTLQFGLGWDHSVGIYAPAIATMRAAWYPEKGGQRAAE
jgi:hypothetical protein